MLAQPLLITSLVQLSLIASAVPLLLVLMPLAMNLISMHAQHDDFGNALLFCVAATLGETPSWRSYLQN